MHFILKVIGYKYSPAPPPPPPPRSSNLEIIVNKPSCFKNPKDCPCINFILTSKKESLLKTKTVVGYLTYLKWWFLLLKQALKIKSLIVKHHDYKSFGNEKFRESLTS